MVISCTMFKFIADSCMLKKITVMIDGNDGYVIRDGLSVIIRL